MPPLFDIVEQLLDVAVKLGIKEFDFWEMTMAEVQRELEAIQFRKEIPNKDKAYFDYMQAQLIAIGIGCSINGGEFPKIQEVYSSLFVVNEEALQAEKDEISAIRFRQFAELHNKQLNSEVKQ